MRPLRRLGPHGFDLDTPEQFSGADDEVITFTVSPRLGDSESATGCFAHKGKLSEFAAMLIVECFVRWFGLRNFFRDRQSGPKREQDRDPQVCYASLGIRSTSSVFRHAAHRPA